MRGKKQTGCSLSLWNCSSHPLLRHSLELDLTVQGGFWAQGMVDLPQLTYLSVGMVHFVFDSFFFFELPPGLWLHGSKASISRHMVVRLA